jgi:hypothetical protein
MPSEVPGIARYLMGWEDLAPRGDTISARDMRALNIVAEELTMRLDRQAGILAGLAIGCTALVVIITLLGKRKIEKAQNDAAISAKNASIWETVATGATPMGGAPETLILAESRPELNNLGMRSVWTQPVPGKFSRNPIASFNETPSPAAATVSFEQLTAQVARNIVHLFHGNFFCVGFRFCDNFFVVPGHFLSAATSSVKVTFVMSEHVSTNPFSLAAGMRAGTNGSQIVRRNYEFMNIPGKDLAVLWLSAVHPSGPSCAKFVADGSQFGFQHQFDRSVFVHRSAEDDLTITPITVSLLQEGGLASDGEITPIRRVWAYPQSQIATAPGFCGSPIVVKRGQSAWVAGIHVSARAEYGHADELVALEILSVIEHIKGACPIAGSFAPLDLSQGTELQVQMGELHPKSMLNGVTSLNCELIGSIVSLGGKVTHRAHEKSNVVPTSYAWDFDELRQEAVGNEHFVAPKSNGVEVDGVWKQPILNAIKQLETAQNSDPEMLSTACADYLHGLEGLTGIETNVVLSVEEALFGISDSAIGPFDLRTSMGYPFFKKKSEFIDKTKLHEGGRTFMKQVVWDQIDRAHATLKSGYAVIPIVSWTLKDESLKESKNALRKQRVFNSLPFYYNVLLKMYFGPIIAFMTCNKQFFECFAGMNLASSDATFFVRWLTFFGDTLNIDGDMQWCDKGIDNVMMIFIGNVLLSIGRVLQYTEEQLMICSRLFAGLMYMCVYVKGDLMFLVHSNPSGSLLTVVTNSIYLSAQYRVTWNVGMAVAERKLSLPFRMYCHLATLGDDNICNVSPLAPWFTFKLLSKVFLDCGKFLVPADKSDGMYDFKPFSSCSFLKRRFRWSDDLRNYSAVLEMASLAKMLTTRVKTGRSSSPDQEVGILISASLEMFLRGRPTYDNFVVKARDVCGKYSLRTDWIKTYDFHLRNYAEDHFQTWMSE